MKILIIRLSALGDLVIMTSVLEYLKEKGEITLITKRKYFELFEKDPRVNYLVDEEEFERIKHKKFDIGCDLHAKPKTIMKLLQIKASKKCIINKRPIERRLAVWFKKKIKEVPLYKLYVEPFQKIFKEYFYPIPKLNIPFERIDNLPKEYISVFPGASFKTKRWPLEYFLDVSRRVFEKYNLPSVYLGAENMNLPREPYIINRMGTKPLQYIINAEKYATFVVSNDSGPAHIAGAVNTPLFVVFGPTIPEFGFRPVSESKVYLFERKDLSCRPCSLHGEKKCKFGDLRCLFGIKPQDVMRKIDEFFNNSKREYL